jgi:hypothetical protein
VEILYLFRRKVKADLMKGVRSWQGTLWKSAVKMELEKWKSLCVVSQDVVYIGVGHSYPDGYGKVEKLDRAFQLFHNHGDGCRNLCLEN